MQAWVNAAARKVPERIALEGVERSLSYGELLAAAAAGAARLVAMGAEPGGRVAIALPPGEEFVIALHACWLAGMTAVPVDLRLSEEERRARLAGAVVVVSEPLGVVADAVSEAPGVVADAASARCGVALTPDAPAVVLHTSGTTADPKPIVLTFGNFMASALGSAVVLGLDREERWLCALPLTHVAGLSIPVRSALYGTTAVMRGRFEVADVLEELMNPRRRITMVSLVPTMLGRLLDAGLARPPTLRWVLLGGAPVPPALLERAQAAGVAVAPTYGMTETCSQIATFGWPLPGVELKLEADTGEILIRGGIVSSGVVSADGWLHTGDLGRFGERGALEVVGRLADTIITGGENVAPAEVEAVLLEHPAVADAAVFGRADPEWGEAVCALIVARDGVSVDVASLHELCAGRLARFKIPKVFSFAPSLPRTPSGKLLRRQLV